MTLSPPLQAKPLSKEKKVLFYCIIYSLCVFSMAILWDSFLSVHRHAGRGIAAKAQDDTGADPGRGATDQDLNLQVFL